MSPTAGDRETFTKVSAGAETPKQDVSFRLRFGRSMSTTMVPTCPTRKNSSMHFAAPSYVADALAAISRCIVLSGKSLDEVGFPVRLA